MKTSRIVFVRQRRNDNRPLFEVGIDDSNGLRHEFTLREAEFRHLTELCTTQVAELDGRRKTETEDPVRALLAPGMTQENMLSVTANYLGESVAALKAKYAYIIAKKADPGLLRMTLSNRIRNRWKRTRA